MDTQAAPDLDACAREPIRVPGSIQPHGILLVLDPVRLEVTRASANAGPILGVDPEQAIGRPLTAFARWVHALGDLQTSDIAEGAPRYLGSVDTEAGPFHAAAHRSKGSIVVEFEPIEGDPPIEQVMVQLRELLQEMSGLDSIDALAGWAARRVRALTGFDRALVYRFDEEWNGTVIAEDRGGELPSYLDLRFPASDIPAQARELYRINRLRLISDSSYTPVPILPVDGPQLDLTHALLRSVSPVHLQYMRNMGTGASMSISILRGDELWGLISCHDLAPKRVPLHLRTLCDAVGQTLSGQVTARLARTSAEERRRKHSLMLTLLAGVAADTDLPRGLTSNAQGLLELVNASGCVVIDEHRNVRLGETPDDEALRLITGWLSSRPAPEMVVTDSIARDLPALAKWKDVASGMIAIRTSPLYHNYVIWFRPEQIRTVTWGGDPSKPTQSDSALNPRRSFEAWKETVRLRSAPWQDGEVEAARNLRTALVEVVLKRAEEVAALAGSLERTNKELEAFSYSVSHDLRAPIRHIVGYAELLREDESIQLGETGQRFCQTIIDAALSAGELVDGLLNFAQMGRAAIDPMPIDMNKIVEESIRQLKNDMFGREVVWNVHKLTPMTGDRAMIRLVVDNLLSNAVKYTRGREPATIEIGSESGQNEVCFYVRDNGVGFDMRYAHKLFGVFQRLHRAEDFEGTGIGLANVRRVVERHGGRAWAEGAVDRGATFWFSLPLRRTAT